MGYVVRGKVGFRSGGNEELFEAGDAYYGPGHTPILYAGTEVVEFSPTEELGRTMEVVTKNIGGGGGVGGELELPCSDSHATWQALSEGNI
jgi:hypothetical protein